MILDQPLGVIELVIQSSLMAKAVLLILLIFSITSWAIMLNKFFVYRAARGEDNRFLEVFSKTENFKKIVYIVTTVVGGPTKLEYGNVPGDTRSYYFTL